MPLELKKYFGTEANQSSKYIKQGFDILIKNWIKDLDPESEKYYQIFSEVDYKNRELTFNPLIFNKDAIDLEQINNFSKIILSRLSDEYVKSKKLSKNAFSLELLLEISIMSIYGV